MARAKTGTAVVRTKRRTLVFRGKQGPSALMPTGSSESERTSTNRAPTSHATPRGARRAEHGRRFEAHPTPLPRRARRKAGMIHLRTTDCLRDRYATQETDGGRVECQPEPLTIEEASTGRRRCPSRDPTRPCRPTTTHAPFRTQCPATHAPDRTPQHPWASPGSTECMHARTAPTGAEPNRNDGKP